MKKQVLKTLISEINTFTIELDTEELIPGGTRKELFYILVNFSLQNETVNGMFDDL